MLGTGVLCGRDVCSGGSPGGNCCKLIAMCEQHESAYRISLCISGVYLYSVWPQVFLSLTSLHVESFRLNLPCF